MYNVQALRDGFNLILLSSASAKGVDLEAQVVEVVFLKKIKKMSHENIIYVCIQYKLSSGENLVL